MAIIQGYFGVFSGSGHTKYTLYLSLSRLWLLRIPMIYIFGHFTSWGSDGIWYAMLISNVVVSLIGTVIIMKGKWLNSTIQL